MEQLIASGLSIKDSLEVSTLINDKKLGILSNEILSNIKKGASFANTINNMDSIFPPVYRGIISVGDRIGSVEKIFPRLRMYLETQKKIKDKIKSALIYPTIVFITAFVAFIAMVIFVFPKLETMFMEFGGDAALTLQRNLQELKLGFLTFIVCLLIILFLILLLHYFSKNNTRLKCRIDSFILKLPVVGKYLTYYETLNFSFAMETLTSGGVTVDTAITEAMSVVTNEAYRQALSDVNKRIVKGESLSSAFSMHNEFPSYLTKWMLVGERSGNTEQVFSQIRNYFQNEIDLFTSKFMTLIEPTLIVLIGVFLLILVLTIIVPVFSLYGSIL